MMRCRRFQKSCDPFKYILIILSGYPQYFNLKMKLKNMKILTLKLMTQ